MTFDVPLIDAHHHLARLDLGYPWLRAEAPVDRYHGDDRALRRDYAIEEYRADSEGLPLVASVHVENGAADPLAEARWIGEVIAAHGPIPAVHVARAELSAPGADELLDQLGAMAHVRGIRHILNWHPDVRWSHTDRPHIMTEPLWRRRFATLAERGLSFDLQVFGDQLAEAARLAADHPGNSIVLDHAGMPAARDAEYLRRWRSGLAEIARCENVTVKVSAIGTTDHRWSVASLAEIVVPTIDAFGPDRVMFGSNFPVDGLYSSLSALYAAFDEITSRYTRSERAAMFSGTAARTYRIPLD
ncbi:amidohydrolase family protein [uncultured Microbacterium sp.]|uniref:amidohydrolase family protein n=1 Tax=uncultured Microbacterium sp. TaxID=191216 RepID=UPI0025FACD36|nr:amidohydrolase family protein [uncultured Microbacterium sp.]